VPGPVVSFAQALAPIVTAHEPAIAASRHIEGPDLKRFSGFTLVELIVAMTVAGILLALAVPTFRTFQLNTRASAQATAVLLALSYARSEAIKRDVNVTVCPSIDGANCSAGTTWGQGLIVVDPANAGAPLQRVGGVANGTTLKEAASSAAITFFPTGLVSAPATFTFCDVRGAADARAVEITTAGRVAASQLPGKTLAGTLLIC
jgi:type IV fimbrial biogenesis protein FimT